MAYIHYPNAKGKIFCKYCDMNVVDKYNVPLVSNSLFLQNLSYFFEQTDGSYKYPVGSVGDLLKQAKKEIEEFRKILQG